MPSFLKICSLLAARKLRALKNGLLSLTGYEAARNGAFLLAGFWMLAGLHFGFMRLITFLAGVELIGELMIWKLTAMAMLTTFAMVVLSSLIISLTTLFYAADLKFLMRSPIPLRAIFIDKSLETVFFSSWMILLAIVPFILALTRVMKYGAGFFAWFIFISVPLLSLAALIGIIFTLTLMYLFPSSRTRDVVWVLSSLSVGGMYSLLRFSEPEKLVRPDALKLVAEYLQYLQTPTAPYAPSWWLTESLRAFSHGKWDVALQRGLWLFAAAAAVYAAALAWAGRSYAVGYSGAQESRRSHRPVDIPPPWEALLAGVLGRGRALAALFWKERLCFFREVRHWSQIVLVGALVAVYLFSIQRLPLDTAELRSLICFFNIGAAGFVMASLGLRFTFPSISLEGQSWWIIRSAPVSVQDVMMQKFVFSLGPMLLIATALVAASNYLLEADRFISFLSLSTIWLAAWSLSAMGVGLGALFPRFKVENIHQIESSAGGFVYMAAALAYVGATVAAEAWPVKMHFAERMGRVGSWDWDYAGLSIAMLVLINLAATALPWWLGARNLERYEGES